MRRSNGITVYIAMAYTADPQTMVKVAEDTWNELYELGFEPYCPHLLHYVSLRHPKSNRAWLEHVKFWSKKCDAMLRLDVLPSPGADEEEAEFEGPTFRSKGALVEWAAGRASKRRYVVGFAFDEPRERVVLIHKRRGPECVIGRWNGLGGKIEEGESPEEAMAREFEEESGVSIPPESWRHLGVLETKSYILHFLDAASREVLDCRSREDERVDLFDVEELPGEVMPNLRWMIPFALDDEVESWGKMPLVRS